MSKTSPRPDIQYPHRALGDIIKRLEPLTATGYRPDDIFTDWVQLCKATLEAIPGHFEASLKQERYPDTPETEALFAQLRQKYKGSYWDNLSEAFALLWNSSEVYQDVLGAIYMNWGWPNPHTAQYFTPFPVAKMMATTLGVGALVEQRLKEAIYAAPLASAALVSSYLLEGKDKEAWLIARVIPFALPHFKPVTVSDPTCGSGVMFLAAADELPSWATQLGLVQFYGQDIDLLCAEMCRTNILLYGLNGVRARQLVWLAEQTLAGNIREVEVIPEPEPEFTPQTPLTEWLANLPAEPVQVGKKKKSAPQSQLPLFIQEPSAVYWAT